MKPNRHLATGRIVRFIARDGTERPAIVVEPDPAIPGRALLRVFLKQNEREDPSEFDIVERTAGCGILWATEGDTPGASWRWPPLGP